MEIYIIKDGAKSTVGDSTVSTLEEALDLVKQALEGVGYDIPMGATLEVVDGS